MASLRGVKEIATSGAAGFDMDDFGGGDMGRVAVFAAGSFFAADGTGVEVDVRLDALLLPFASLLIGIETVLEWEMAEKEDWLAARTRDRLASSGGFVVP